MTRMRRITNETPLLDQQMATIKSICPKASIEFRGNGIEGSTKWYISAPGLDLVDGSFLRGIKSDGHTANNAVQIAYECITDQSNVFKRNNKTYHRWTGFMFDEVEKPQ
tara:strand:+ start:970 stop:1296 length:327 start_codon:yes stop_codon:yes gene_type:complete